MFYKIWFSNVKIKFFILFFKNTRIIVNLFVFILKNKLHQKYFPKIVSNFNLHLLQNYS